MTTDLVSLRGNAAVFFVLTATVLFVVTAKENEGDLFRSTQREANHCKVAVKKCTAMYTQNLKDIPSDEHVCLMLAAYKLCLVTDASSCTLDTSYHTLITVVSQLFNGLCVESSVSPMHHKQSSLVAKL